MLFHLMSQDESTMQRDANPSPGMLLPPLTTKK